MQTYNSIDDYVRSRGTSLPLDYSKYLLGQKFDAYCCFCKNEFAATRTQNNWRKVAHQVYSYNPLDDSRKPILGLHMCDNCEDHHREMQMQYYPAFFTTDANTHELDPDAETSRESRIYLYNEHQKFDDTVETHYVYLDGKSENYKHTPSTACYFCKKPSVGHHRHQISTVEQPLQEHMFLLGGKVFVCDSDFAELVSPNKYGKAKCVRCEQSYLVEDNEASAMAFEGTTKYRMCPECTYQEVNKIVPYHILLSSEDNLKIRSTPITRLIPKKCDYCGDAFMIDLCVSHAQLERQHMTGNRIHCLTCYRLGITRANGNKFYFRAHSNVYVLITKQSGFWTYSVCKIVNKELQVHLKSAINLTKDVSECIFLASQAAWKMFPINQQGELWERP